MQAKLRRISRSVLYSNGDLWWDWLTGVGESFIAADDAPDNSARDRFLLPKRWWPELPPCSLAAIALTA